MRRPETTGEEQAGGRFQPGKSGNPAGRPIGARNRTTLAALAILEGEAEALSRKAVELALAGDAGALRLCLERLVPPIKDRPIPEGAVTLPKLPTEPGLFDILGTRADAASQGLAAVVEAVGAGRLTPSEGDALAGLLERYAKRCKP